MRPNWDALSIVILDSAGHLAAMQKSILRGEGLRKLSLVDSPEALQNDLLMGRDIVLINWMAMTDGFVDIVKALRNRETSPDPYIGVIVVAAPIHLGRIQASINCGANSFLRFPFSATDLLRHIGHVATVPPSFVETPTYFGPCRRRRADPYWEGDERRLSEGALIEGGALQDERTRRRQSAMHALEAKISAAG